MIGRLIGHYRILEQIGAGGMGIVYRARDERLHRDVAIKVLTGAAIDDADARKRVQREALALSQLNHPNIEIVHAFEHHEGLDYLVMEFVEGESLDSVVARGPLSEDLLRSIGVQLMRALEAAHARGIVHRDLKPSNLMITRDGLLKVLDFGVARITQPPAGSSLSLTEAGLGVLTGTLPYIAPEQIRGEPADARSDVYGAGAVLFELATGRRPFQGDDPAALLYHILNTNPPVLRDLGANVGESLERLIQEALSKDPAMRPPSAAAMREQLETPAPSSAPSTRATVPAGSTGALHPQPPRGPGRRVLALLTTIGVLSLLFLVVRARFPASAEAGSVAVLPFANPSGRPEQEYFADGMTEHLISELSRIGTLRVISRTSAMQYKHTSLSLPAIMEQLGVQAVVEGSVVEKDGQLRVAVTLIGSGERKLWSETFDREIGSVVALQHDIARNVARGVRARLAPGTLERLSRDAPVHPEAYRAYLQGLHGWTQPYTLENLRLTEENFHRSVDLDPGFAPAWAGLSLAYYEQSSWAVPPDVAMPRARAAAQQALAIDPELPEALTALATVHIAYDWKWSEAQDLLDRALQVAPGYAEARAKRGYLLLLRGRTDEAIHELREARNSDPFSSAIAMMSLFPLYEGRRYEQALKEANTLLAVDSVRFANARLVRAQALLQTGRTSEAMEEMTNLTRQFDHAVLRGWLCYFLGRAGRSAEADRELRALEARAKTEYVPAHALAIAHMGLGHTDRTLDWLESGVSARQEEILIIALEPEFDALRADPRFRRLIRTLGLEDQA